MDMQSHQVFVDNVWRLMHEQGMIPADLARALGWDLGQLAKYIGRADRTTPIENLTTPKLNTLDAFAIALDTTSSVLLHQEVLVAA